MVIALLAGGCGGTATREQHVTAADTQSPWPFTAPAGTIACDPVADGLSAVTFRTPDGTVYAINGTARTHGDGADIAESGFWRDDPDNPGAKVDIGEIIELGLQLCAGG